MRPLLRSRFSSTVTILAVAVTGVNSSLIVHNWCNTTISLWISNAGGCDLGPSHTCSSVAGTTPFTLSSNNTLSLPWLANNSGTSVKILKNTTNVETGVLQFEYTRGGEGMWWDLSEIDGLGEGKSGSLFGDDNVVVLPVGEEGLGAGTCKPLVCERGTVCKGAYLNPDDVATRYCPLSVDTFWVDLCVPDAVLAKGTAALKS